MAAPAITCGECEQPLAAEDWNRPEASHCRGCGAQVEILAFPAIERRKTGALPEAIDAESEASCFYHPQSRAAVPCDRCGRFLCRLCELDVDGQRLCPACFDAGVASNQIASAVTSRTMYDSIALATATLPALLFWPAFVGGPLALYLVCRRWNAPSSVVPRTKIRFILAALFATAEIAGAGFLIWALIHLPWRPVTP